MVKQIASRAAGMRLFLIVAVLLLPIAVLYVFMLQETQGERSVLQSELQGVAINKVVMPILLSASRAQLNPQEMAKLKLNGHSAAVILGVDENYQKLIESLNAKRPDYDVIAKNAVALITTSSEASGLVLDSELESYNLAIAISSIVPDSITYAKLVQIKAMHSSATFGKKQDLTVSMLLAAGRWSESLLRLRKSFLSAKNGAEQKSTYNSIIEIVDHVVKDSEIATAIADKDSSGYIYISQSKASTVGSMVPHAVEDITGIWKAALQKLEQRLKMRHQSATQHMVIMSAIALLTTIIGVGFAAAMFRSTLKQLDDVEAARRTADLSRDAAEDMSSKLSVINGDMAKLNRDLEANMRQLTEAQAEIVKKTKFANLGQLTATVAHELRNPLGAVRTSAFLLERKLKGKGLGVEPQLLRINNGITRCDDTITQLLDFSRSKQINSSKVEVDQWLISVIEEEARKLPTSVNIACTLGLEGYEVPLDKARLERAVVNLIANASEAMVGKGEGSILTITVNPTITIETRLNGEFFEIEISDNGPGISAENLLKIREPMFTTKNFGTGLGIPAVEQILEQHGGTLDIQSTIGQGAKFTMRLPVKRIEEEAA
jgi:signal transduction histidine kinase